MPTLFLRRREAHLRERMEAVDCDPELLWNTYAQFRYVNPVISGWRRVYKRWLRPRLRSGPCKLIDVGCGGGDVVESLSRWTRHDGLRVEITALEPDARAVEYLRSASLSENVLIRHASTVDLVKEGRTFDVVISNHVIHHLDTAGLHDFLRDTESLATRLVVHNDIRRDDLAYLGFLPTGLFFRKSFITIDGLTSIRRSYLADELRAVLPPCWQLRKMALFRNLLILER